MRRCGWERGVYWWNGGKDNAAWAMKGAILANDGAMSAVKMRMVVGLLWCWCGWWWD